jgi:surface protein
MKKKNFILYCSGLGVLVLIGFIMMLVGLNSTYYVKGTYTTVKYVPDKPQDMQHYEAARDSIVKQEEGINQDINNWNTSSVTSMSEMFSVTMATVVTGVGSFASLIVLLIVLGFIVGLFIKLSTLFK